MYVRRKRDLGSRLKQMLVKFEKKTVHQTFTQLTIVLFLDVGRETYNFTTLQYNYIRSTDKLKLLQILHLTIYALNRSTTSNDRTFLP